MLKKSGLKNTETKIPGFGSLLMKKQIRKSRHQNKRTWRYEKQSKACRYRGMFKISLFEAWDRVKKENNAAQGFKQLNLNI